jgi:hypothetical protein
MTITTDRIPDAVLRAMERARRDGIRTQLVRLPAGDLRLTNSASEKGTRHAATFTGGKVTGCDCKGAAHGSVCKHQGAWIARSLRERGIKVKEAGTAAPASSPAPVAAVESGCRGRSHLFREEAA